MGTVHKYAALCAIAVLAAAANVRASAQTGNAEQQTARYLDSIRHNPSLLRAFVRAMPKGGDLHNHLFGAVYAESFVELAAKDGLCVDRKTVSLVPPPCDDAERPAAAKALTDFVLYREMVDAFSMRDWQPGHESAHDHFFDTFFKFDAVTHAHIGDMLAQAASIAAADNLIYLELMHTADNGESRELGARVGWEDDFDQLRSKMLAEGMTDLVSRTRKTLDEDEAHMREDLHCAAADADPGCRVTVRYLYQVLRGFPPEEVFAQILLGFELAQADPRFVGLNLVMPEDWYIPMRDFHLHMRMIDYLHQQYPKVHITLHAGELSQGMVTPDGLTFHIRDSIDTGHAERIGHGVDIMHEHDPIALLKQMARQNILVEICLTSNDVILGVRGVEHPLPTYMKYGVPVALATDDEGVSRGDMTEEYLRAVQTYGFSYSELKRMARQSLEHSFLAGESLWKKGSSFQRVQACASDIPGKPTSKTCGKFLAQNQRAQVQWNEEIQFAKFEQCGEKAGEGCHLDRLPAVQAGAKESDAAKP